ncbi:hypothetical protein Gotur_009489, partial [Gossypium turneri]
MIVEQNNYTNINLHTIGKQLDYIENFVESQPIRKEPVKEIIEKSSSETEPEPEENTQEYIMVLTEVSIQRYLVKINIVINNEFQLETIT